jgi:NADH-quinone oxidoreductase subunit F
MLKYYITTRCAGCGGCHSVCPLNCIDTSSRPLVIDQKRCVGCGWCELACPLRAIEHRSQSQTVLR